MRSETAADGGKMTAGDSMGGEGKKNPPSEKGKIDGGKMTAGGMAMNGEMGDGEMSGEGLAGEEKNLSGKKGKIDGGKKAEGVLAGGEGKKNLGGEKVKFDEEKKTVIASAEIAALYFGVTKATLSNWVKDGCPRYSYGWYDIKAVGEYRLEATGAVGNGGGEKDVSLMTVQQQKAYFEQKLKAAQAEAAEFKNEIARGDYLEKDMVTAEVKNFCVILKNSLEALGRKLSREIAVRLSREDSRSFDKMITDTIDDALEQLSVDGVYLDEEN